MAKKIKQEFKINSVKMATVQTPIMVEKIVRKIVWFGLDNLYPKFLLDSFYKSNKLSAMVGTIADMISGEGFVIEGKSEALINFFENPNNKETLDEILPKIGLDIAIYGAFSLNVIWSKGGKTIAQIKYIDVASVRWEEENIEDENDFEWFYTSADWANTRKDVNKPQRIAGFDKRNTSEKSQLMYVTKYKAGMKYYGIPHYFGGMKYIQLDYQVANFHLQSALQGYTPSIVVNFATGIPATQEERDDAVAEWDANMRGTDNASGAIFTFSEGKDQAVEITPIASNGSDRRFIELEKQIIQNILIANKATYPGLFGIETPGKLGGKGELLEAFELYQMTFIQSFQDVITNALQKLVDINGVDEDVEIAEYKIFKEIIEQEEEAKEDNTEIKTEE